MPPLATLPLFAATALGLLLIPGPSVLYITTRSASHGRRAGLVSVLGVHTGTCVHVLAAVVGVSALVMASAVAFTAIKVAGGAYLIYLGTRTILGHRSVELESGLPKRSLRRLYVDGAVVNLLNPKTALFFMAFLPQFIDPAGAPVWSQTLLLGVVFLLLGCMSDSCYAMAGAGVGRWLSGRPGGRRRGRYAEGGMLVGLGVTALATPHRSRIG